MGGIERWMTTLQDAYGISPPLVGACAIMLVGWLIALVTRNIIVRMLSRGTEVDQPGATSVLRGTDIERSARTIGRVAFWLIVALAFTGATERLGLPIVASWFSSMAAYLPRALATLLVIGFGMAAGRFANAAAARAAATSGLPDGLRMGRMVESAVLGVTALIAIETLGIGATFLQSAILIILGSLLAAVSLAFGLGSRELVSDILACHYVRRLYEVGGVIRIERSGEEPTEGRLLRIAPPHVIVDTPRGEEAVPGRWLTTGKSVAVRPQAMAKRPSAEP